MHEKAIEYDILKNIDKVLNHLNFLLNQIYSIMYVNTQQ